MRPAIKRSLGLATAVVVSSVVTSASVSSTVIATLLLATTHVAIAVHGLALVALAIALSMPGLRGTQVLGVALVARIAHRLGTMQSRRLRERLCEWLAVSRSGLALGRSIPLGAIRAVRSILSLVRHAIGAERGVAWTLIEFHAAIAAATATTAAAAAAALAFTAR
jgi:hypothetical protein